MSEPSMKSLFEQSRSGLNSLRKKSFHPFGEHLPMCKVASSSLLDISIHTANSNCSYSELNDSSSFLKDLEATALHLFHTAQ